MKKYIIILCVITLLIMSFCAIVAAEGKVVLTLGHDGAIGSIQDLAVKRIVEVADELSNGQLEIQDFPAGQLGSNISMLESVLSGSQDIYWGDLAWLGNFVKDYAILSMGFAFRDQKHMNNFMDSSIGQDLKSQLLDKGLLLMREHANQLPRVMVSKFLVRTPEDVQGVKMRVPGIPIFQKVWNAVGTKTTSVNWGEVYLALSQGIVDAMECGFEFVYANKFYEVAKYVTLTNHVRGIRGMIINPEKYDSLPLGLKAVIEKAAIEGEKLYNEKILEAKGEHTKLLLENGVTITEVDNEPWKAKILPIVNDLEAEGFWSKGLFEKVQEVK